MLITGLLAPINAESPVSIFTSRATPCVVEQPQDEPVSAVPGAQEPT